MAHANLNPDRDYDRLQRALDRQVTGAPASPAFMQILRLLYAPDEAALAARVPILPTPLDKLARQMGRGPEELDAQLTRLAERGLILDLSANGRRYYALPPVVIGFFEFTFMRARPDMPMADLARLFEIYMTEDDGRFARAVFDQGTAYYNKLLAGIKANRLANILWTVGIRAPVRKGILEKLGGRVRLMISGGAPADPKMLAGLEELGLVAREGYGITECSPVLSLTPIDAPIRPGSCGRILPFIEMRVFNANSEGVGELAAKGGNIMTGYYNNPAATEDVFRDGWFLTGDLGYIDADNYVYITGRKKALIVNREGKNIYPEEVEMQINQSPLILESVVLGYRPPGETVGEQVGVIVVPDEEGLAALEAAEKRKFSEDEIAARLRAEVKKLVAALADYKHPRRIQIRWEEFNKTSTGKIKRYLYAMSDAGAD